jgi:hypothetical protein
MNVWAWMHRMRVQSSTGRLTSVLPRSSIGEGVLEDHYPMRNFYNSTKQQHKATLEFGGSAREV